LRRASNDLAELNGVKKLTRIGMILDKPFPPDIRVEKEAKALLDAGYEVGLLAADRGSEPSRTVNDFGLVIFRVSVRPSSRWQRARFGLTLKDEQWRSHIDRFIREFRADILHVHDFPRVRSALDVAEPLEIPVVADLHENIAAAYRVYRSNAPFLARQKDAVIRNYHVWQWHERNSLKKCSKVITVVPEMARRLEAQGVEPNKLVVVSNTEDESTFEVLQPDRFMVDEYASSWTVSYIGGVAPHRGIESAIKAIPSLVDLIPNFKLLIVGAKDDRHTKNARDLITELDVDTWVDVLGWQPFSMIGGYMAISQACIVPHIDSEQTQAGVPHKLFQYMLSGRPVVVSDVRPLKRIIEETRAGLVFKAGDPESLAEVLIELYQDPELAAELGNNGRKAATGKYAWRNDARRLVTMYEELIGKPSEEKQRPVNRP
jgi:glycosyltransferase involved in cell wall biosynthesis